MSITGWYHVKTIKTVDEDRQMVALTPDEYLESVKKRYEGDPSLARELMQAKMAACNKIIIGEDGMIKTYVPVPENITEEQKEQAKAAGYEFTDDGYFRPDPNEGNAWKEEDGKFLYDSKVNGEILGEKQSPWADLLFDGSTVTMSMGLVVYEKE